MSRIDDFTLDTSGTQSMIQVISPDWQENIDAMLEAYQQLFQQEDQQGYDNLVNHLRAWTWSHKIPEDHPDFTSPQQIANIATEIRSKAKAWVTVGIGGSDLGARTLHDLLNHPYHNEMVIAGQITGIPEIYFTGDTFDPLRLQALLAGLKRRGILKETYINIVSKSGTTAETALAGMILADALGEHWMSQTVATTGLNDKSLLFNMQGKGKGEFLAMLPVPDGVGGRFSFASPVGMLLLAVTAPSDPLKRIQDAYEGYATGHDAFLTQPVAHNLSYQLARFLHMAETCCGKSTLVFYPYLDNRKLGDWFVQLYAESVQERGMGLNVIATTGPTGNHSLLNGIVNGPRDKIIVFLTPDDFESSLAVPADAPLEGSLEIFEGKTLAEVQTASLSGTALDFTLRSIPNLTLHFPRRDTASVFILMRILMDMVAVKGCLQSLHIDPVTGEPKIGDSETYIQTGVEGYKQQMRESIQNK